MAAAFDLAYPGQYRRIIKAVCLTVPCVTGPYTNVSATLSLLGSDVRLDANDPTASPSPSPSSRTTTVAASTAQNDAGVFELTFRGERYLPFEGAGAVNSQWRLSLPTTFRPFDYLTVKRAVLALQPAEDVSVGAVEFALDDTSVSGFAGLPQLGGLPGVDVTSALTGDPRGERTLEVRASGDLAPDDGGPPALAADKLDDLVLYLEYGLDA